MENTDPRYYEVVPTPGEDVELMPGDRVWIEYPLFQTGTWYVGYQVGQVEQDMERQGQFELLSYVYDEAAKTLLLKYRVRNPEEIPPTILMAGAPSLNQLLVALVALAMIAYESEKIIKVLRMSPKAVADAIERIDSDPTMTDAEKQQARAVVMRQANPADTIPGALGGLAAALAFAGLAVLALVWFGGRK